MSGFMAFLTRLMPNVMALGWSGETGWGTAIGQTLFMTFWSAVFGGFLGLAAAVALVLTGPSGIRRNRAVFMVLDKIVDVFRAVPFIILLAVLSPLTRAIVGTQIGERAALVPLSLSLFPFYARQVQSALETVAPGKIESAQALGATVWDLVTDVYLREARPQIIRVSTVSLISLVGLTAMAGAVGAGGLGNTAILYGYNRFNNDVTVVATLLVLFIVLIIQLGGDFLARRLDHTRARG